MKILPIYRNQIKRRSIRFFTIVLFILIFNSCKQTNNRAKNISQQDTSKVQISVSKPNISNETISTPCAVIISATDIQIDSLKKVDGDEFYSITDSNLYYIDEARKYLDSTKTLTINKKAIGQITFKLKNGEEKIIDLSEFFWAILLFNGHDEPLDIDISTFKSEFPKYMITKNNLLIHKTN